MSLSFESVNMSLVMFCLRLSVKWKCGYSRRGSRAGISDTSGEVLFLSVKHYFGCSLCVENHCLHEEPKRTCAGSYCSVALVNLNHRPNDPVIGPNFLAVGDVDVGTGGCCRQKHGQNDALGQSSLLLSRND